MSPLRSCSRVLVVFSLLSLGGPLRAAADTRSLPSPAPDADPKNVSARDEANSLEKAANKAISEYRQREAADLYGRAWDVYRDPRYICNRGSLLLGLERHIEAAQALTTCIKANKDQYGAVSAAIEGLFRRARAPICTLEVTTNVLGAAITVANKVVGKDPLDGPLFIEAGNYIVSATADHYDSAATSIECPPGKWELVAFELLPALRPGEVMDAPATNKPPVVSSPRSVVSTGDPPASPLFVTPIPEPPNSSRTILVLTGGGMTLVGAGIAVGLFVGASRNSAEATDIENSIASRDPLKACNGPTPDYACGGINAKRQNAALLMGLGVAPTIVAAGGIALTLYGIFSGPSSNQPGSAALTVTPAPGGGWLGMSGRF